MKGLDLLGAQYVPPTEYTDAQTVSAVQAALNAKGADLVVDGKLGPKTRAAIKTAQGAIGAAQTGKIDTTLLAALGVSVPPNAAVQAQAALDTATAAEHAQTPADVQDAASQLVSIDEAAAPPLPPAVKQATAAAVQQARNAVTPADVKKAAAALKSAAMAAYEEVKLPWWKAPAWPGGPASWKVGATGAGVIAAGVLAAVYIK